MGHLCPFGKNILYVSRDEGEFWSDPMIINDRELDDRDAGLKPLGNGKLMLTYFNHPREFYFAERNWVAQNTNAVTHDMSLGLLDGWKNLTEEQNHGGSFVRLSRDGGNTWDPAVKVPVTSPHGPIRLANGKLFFLGKEFWSGRYEKGAILAFESEDEGKTWQYLSKVDFPHGCTEEHIYEPYAIELPDGRIL